MLVSVLLARSGLTEDAAASDEEEAAMLDLAVNVAIVRPLKSNGQYWDGVHLGGAPKIAAKSLRRATELFVTKELVKAGLDASGAALAARTAIFVARAFNDAMTQPDPFGELIVDGRVVATLPLLHETLTPKWPAITARFVQVTPTSSIEIRLADADASGAHDAIGSCTFVGHDLLAHGGERISRVCTGDLTAAGVVVGRSPTPVPVATGEFRLALVRAGISPSKPDGRPWDPSGLGDPQINIEVDGVTFGCPKTQGQRASICEPSNLSFHLTPQTKVSIRVVDADAVFDDYIGTAVVTDLQGPAHVPITMRTTGALDWAELVLVPSGSDATESKHAAPSHR